MITDSETNLLYLSDQLVYRNDFYESLKALLKRNRIRVDLLPQTNDIWAVDYMPIQASVNRFIRFKYDPDYLQNDEFILTITDTKSVCKAIGLNVVNSEIRIDGGNVIKGKDWVIMTDKIFDENPDFRRKDLIRELEDLFEVKVLIISQEPDDFTGHADGIVRYYDDDTVLVNCYKPADKRDFQKRLTKELKSHGLRTIRIPYNPYIMSTMTWLTDFTLIISKWRV